MTQNNTAGQPGLAELFARYLQSQVEAQAEGLGYADPGDEAFPYDTTPMQPVDPRLAWNDAVGAANHLLAAGAPKTWTVPPDWPMLVAAQEPAFGLAFALGNFPQLVRDLQPLLGGKLSPPSPSAHQGGSSNFPTWAERNRGGAQGLLTAGVLRLARHFEQAQKLLAEPVSPALESARANEQAALAWHSGKAEQALALWRQQPDSVPVHFNRGMACLFLGRPGEAVPELNRAVAALPETSAWHHLGQLYLALASNSAV